MSACVSAIKVAVLLGCLSQNLVAQASVPQLAQDVFSAGSLPEFGWGNVAVASDGDLLAYTARDRSLMLYRISSGRTIKRLTLSRTLPNRCTRGVSVSNNFGVLELTHSGASPQLVAMSGDGRWVAAAIAGCEFKIGLWNAATGEQLHFLQSGDGYDRVGGLSFDQGGELLFGGGNAGELRAWAVRSGLPYRIFNGWNRGEVRFTPDGKSVFSGAVRYSADSVHWSTTTLGRPVGLQSECSRLQAVERASVDAVGRTTAVSSNGRVAVCREGEADPVYLGENRNDTQSSWAAGERANQPQRKVHSGRITAVVLSSNGRLVATAGLSSARSHEVKLWDSREGVLLRTFHGHSEEVYHLTFAAHDALLISAGLREGLLWWALPVPDSSALVTSACGPKDEFETNAQFVQRVGRCRATADSLARIELVRRATAVQSTRRAVSFTGDAIEHLGYSVETGWYLVALGGVHAMIPIGRDEARTLNERRSEARVTGMMECYEGEGEGRLFNLRLVHPVSGRSYPFGTQREAVSSGATRVGTVTPTTSSAPFSSSDSSRSEFRCADPM